MVEGSRKNVVLSLDHHHAKPIPSGKHLSASVYSERKGCVAQAYQKKVDGKYKGTKTPDFCGNYNIVICKNCSEKFCTKRIWKN